MSLLAKHLLGLSILIIVACGCQQDNETTNDSSTVRTQTTVTTSVPSPSDAPSTEINGNDSRDDSSDEPNPIEATSRATTNEPIDISFDDVQINILEDMVFRPIMLTDRAHELDGKTVRIHGYMLPDSKTKGIKQFVLLKNTECKFGPGGRADHLVNVLMDEGKTTSFRGDPVSVVGVLTINPFQGPDNNTWSIYDLACKKVEKYRPRR